MAKRHKDLGDWEIVLQDSALEGPSTPSRRSRRGQTQNNQAIKLRREIDDTTLGKGDCILLSGAPKHHEEDCESYFAIIFDIRLGLQNHLEIDVLPFVDVSKLSADQLSDKMDHELLLMSECEPIRLRDYIEKIAVLCHEDFVKLSKDELTASTVFCCHRAADRLWQNFSSVFDYKEWHLLLLENQNEALAFLAERTLIIISPKKAQRQVRTLTQRRQASPLPKKRDYNEESSPEEEDSDDSKFSLSSDENDKPEDNDFSKPFPRKRKIESGPTTPRKKARDVVRDTGAFKQVLNVLSPLNKGFKVKTTATVSSLPSLSRSRVGLPTKPESTTSEAFRQLREKLHTSTRVKLLPCREEQFEELYLNLESAVMEGVGCCLYVSGTPGVGKTATIREAIATLRDNHLQGYVKEFDYLEINSLKLVDPTIAYEKLYEHLTKIKVTPANASLLLEEHFGKTEEVPDRLPLILVIDELDQLVTKNQHVMYNFFNWPTYPNSKLIVIAIANTMDLPERLLSNKIASRLGLRRYSFRGYTEEELGIIIAQRLTLLSEENKRKVTVSIDAMNYASKKVALVSGDARRALTICRRAVEIAEREYLDTTDTTGVRKEEQVFPVKISHISMAISETTNSPLSQYLLLLPFTSKLVLAAVLLRMRRSGLGDNPLGDIIDEMKNSLSLLTSQNSTKFFQKSTDHASYLSLLYSDDRPTSINRVRARHFEFAVNSLVELGIILQQNANSERYRLISLNVSEDEILSVLRKDDDFAAMV